MHTSSRILSLLLTTAASLAATPLTGCTSIGSATHSEDAAGREGLVLDGTFDLIDAPTEDRRTLYVQFRDASGRGIDLRNALRSEMKDRGYVLSGNPDTADYRLEVTLISFDRRPAGDSRDGTSQAVATGASQGFASVFGGIPVAGPLASNLIGTGVANQTTAKEWALVADVKFAQKIEGGVGTRVESESAVRRGSAAGREFAGGRMGGERTDTSTRSQVIDGTKSHIEYNARLTAFTAKWGMDSAAEAQAALLPRVLHSLAEALPRVG